MATKMKRLKKTRPTKSPFGSKSSSQRRTIESRDLNEDEQLQSTNSKTEKEDYGIQNTSPRDEEDDDSNAHKTVEAEEDNEQLRREDEERGKEQV